MRIALGVGSRKSSKLMCASYNSVILGATVVVWVVCASTNTRAGYLSAQEE